MKVTNSSNVVIEGTQAFLNGRNLCDIGKWCCAGRWRKKTGSEPRCRMRPYPPLPLWLVKQGLSAFYYLSHLTFRMRGRPVGRMDLVCGHPGSHFPRFPTPASDTSFCANIRYIGRRRKVLSTYEPTFPCCWACMKEKISHYKHGLNSSSNHPHCGKSVPRHGCELV
jgi:hypothetical protein